MKELYHSWYCKEYFRTLSYLFYTSCTGFPAQATERTNSSTSSLENSLYSASQLFAYTQSGLKVFTSMPLLHNNYCRNNPKNFEVALSANISALKTFGEDIWVISRQSRYFLTSTSMCVSFPRISVISHSLFWTLHHRGAFYLECIIDRWFTYTRIPLLILPSKPLQKRLTDCYVIHTPYQA